MRRGAVFGTNDRRTGSRRPSSLSSLAGAVFSAWRHSLCNSGSIARTPAATAASMKPAACSNRSADIMMETFRLPPQRGRPMAAVCPLLHQPRLDSWVAGADLSHLRYPAPRERLRLLASGICAERRFDVAEEIDSGLPGSVRRLLGCYSSAPSTYPTPAR